MKHVVVITPAEPVSPDAMALAKRLAAQVREAGMRDAAAAERACRDLLIARLPRTGAWLADHPRALRLLFRLRPGLRPTVEWVRAR